VLNSSKVRLNIRSRMVLLCLGVAAPLLAIGSFSLVKEYRTLKLEAERATTLQAATGVRTVSSWIESQLHSLSALASLSAKGSLVSNAQTNITLSTALVAQPSWSKLFLTSPSGEKILAQAERDNHGAVKSLAETSAMRSLLASTIASGKAAMGPATVFDNHGHSYLLASAPVWQNGQIKAQIVAVIDPKAVLNLFSGLTGLADQSSAVIAVVDTEKRVIARTIENDFWQGKDFSHAKTVQAASHRQKGTLEAIGIADPTPRAYAFDHVPNTNWQLTVGLPTSTIYGTAHDWLILMISLASCAIGVSFVLAYSATSHFTKTINGLVREALSLGKGDFSKRVEVKSSDELGLLARAFNEMANTLELDRDQKNMVKRISDSVRQSLDLDEILNTTVKELGQNLNASRCCLALIDTHQTAELDDDELSFDYVWWNEEFNGNSLTNRKVLISENDVLRRIIDQGSIIWLDVLENQNQPPVPVIKDSGTDAADWRSIKTLIACPIQGATGILGLILVHQCDQVRAWSPSELELVEVVANQVSLAIAHGRLYSHAKTLAEKEQLINHIVRSVRTSLDVDTILDTVTSELSKALGADRVQIAQPRAEGPLIVTHEHHEENLECHKGLSLYGSSIDFHPNAKINSIVTDAGNSVLGIALSQTINQTEAEVHVEIDAQTKLTFETLPASLSVINQVAGDFRCAAFSEYLNTVGSQSLIAAPLLNENQLMGVLVVHQCERQRQWSEHEIRMVSAIADQLAVAIAHAQLFAQVRHQAITDGLTGLYNHVYFKNRLTEELRTAERKGTPVSLIMIDLDKLKVINDTHGHPVGDAAIRQIGAILKTLLRSGDTAARYGGEEFGIILPETSLLEAALIADRLCSQIRNTHVPGLGKITASLGTACYPKQARSSSELIEKADKALYVAKNSGRDQVRVFEEDYQSTNGPTFTNVTREMERALKKTGLE
jgi:diguanylate cyclase (GGDEF)-like protein